MKLTQFAHKSGYHFLLSFANGETLETDLQSLIEKHVDMDAVQTAHLNSEWGCLEFKNGMVDIEPKTLYRYAKNHTVKLAA
jgi:hypothetical protein